MFVVRLCVIWMNVKWSCSLRGRAIPFTTDTAAALRGMEMNANIVLKATKVDGIYTSDPLKNKDAQRFQSLTFDEAISKTCK